MHMQGNSYPMYHSARKTGGKGPRYQQRRQPFSSIDNHLDLANFSSDSSSVCPVPPLINDTPDQNGLSSNAVAFKPLTFSPSTPSLIPSRSPPPIPPLSLPTSYEAIVLSNLPPGYTLQDIFSMFGSTRFSSSYPKQASFGMSIINVVRGEEVATVFFGEPSAATLFLKEKGGVWEYKSEGMRVMCLAERWRQPQTCSTSQKKGKNYR